MIHPKKDKPDNPHPGKPDTTGDIPTTVVCDQCGHPKKAHRQNKYYCEADMIQNDPANNNVEIKVMCSCTRYENAEEDKQKEKDKQEIVPTNLPSPAGKQQEGEAIYRGPVEVIGSGEIING